MKSTAQLKEEIERLQQSVDEQALELDSKNRELEIERALDRVRARAMAMHKSEELRELVFEFYKQIHPFGLGKWGFEIKIAKEDKSGFYCWISPPGARVQPEGFEIPTLDHWVLKKYWTTFELQVPSVSIEVSGNDKRKLGDLLLSKSDMKNLPEEVRANIIDTEYVHFSVAAMKFGLLKAVDMELVPAKNSSILQRFAKVFEQTYTRFLDLQKAEAQAREAQIEAALERVRAKALAMHSSDQLISVAIVLREQMQLLGQTELIGTVVELYETHPNHIESWHAFRPAGNQDASIETGVVLFEKNSCAVVREMIELYQSNHKNYTIEASGEKIIEWYNVLKQTVPELKNSKIPEQEFYCCADFSGGTLLMASIKEPSIEAKDLLMRSAKVFDLAYTRFLDLQKAEAQAREAQIEAALERVRSRSLGMQTTKEMQLVANEIREQLLSLGLQIDALAMIGVIDNEAYYDVWVGGAFSEKPLRILYNKDTKVQREYNKVIKERPEIFTKTYSGKIMKAYLKHLMASNTFNPELEKLMLECNAFTTTLTHMKNSGLQIIRYKPHPFSDSDNKIVIRFGKVFEQAYIRFLDLQKAEAQAREAQIEAALERVRARTMAMQRSEQLGETAAILFKQFDDLGINVWSSGFQIWKDDNISTTAWMSSAGGEVLSTGIRLPHTEDPYFINIYNSRGTPDRLFVMESKGKELEDTYRYMFNIPEWKKAFGDIEDAGFPIPKYQITHCVYFTHGYLMLITHDSYPEYWDIFKRFGKVFDQTYTRFLDLQKAEAQAKEAQVETGLERVRSRTMGMQRSEELLEVGELVYKELSKLGIASMTSGVTLVDQAGKMDSYYVVNPDDGSIMKDVMGIPRDETKVMRSLTASWEKQEPFHIISLNEKETILHQTYIAENSTNFPFTAEELISYTPAKLNLQSFNFKYGYLILVGAEKLSEEKIDITIRFAKVFEQTYTRFLDLQKAEAQAREAEIELALERVRSRTMAMHKSEELAEVAALLFKQLKMLGADLWTAVIAFCKEGDLLVEKWGGSPITDQIFDPVFIPYNADHGEQRMYDTWKNQEALHSYTQGGKELKDIYDHLMTIPSFKASFQRVVDSGRPLPVWQKNHVASYKYGYLLIITESEFKEEHVFPRFAKVFEQTYTRFLDLKKAETQAREAQIEVSLERVRSRSMAMHKSEELIDTATLLYQELSTLGIQPYSTGFILVDEKNEKQEVWFSAPGGKSYMNRFFLPLTGDPVLNERYRNWKNKEPIYYERVAGEKLIEHLQFVSTFFGTREAEEQAQVFPECVFFYCGYFPQGYLHILTENMLDADQELIMKRFTQAFSMTYTRFLDLQKAEAQAKEAQIEGALERVRSRTMAMHQSSELNEVSVLLYKELMNLGISDFFNCGYVELHEKNKVQYAWVTRDDGTFLGKLELPLTGDKVLNARYDAWKMEKPLFRQVLNSNQLKSHLAFISPQHKNKEADDVVKRFPNPTIFYNANFKHGYLHINTGKYLDDEGESILIRFTQVFAQTYTRFLDLQKAEAQAREAEIQLALERVRARTMAMQKSDELSEAGDVLFQQLHAIGIVAEGSWITLINPEEDSMTMWVTHDNIARTPKKVFGKDHPNFRAEIDAWKSKKESIKIQMPYDDFVRSSKEIFGIEGISAPEKPIVYIQHILHGFGYLGASTFEEISEKDIGIYKRFTKVFEQTYTRFLDLKKAEAQAREAEIQLALERVRARTMAMHKSDELAELNAIILKQVHGLNVEIFAAGVHIADFDNPVSETWIGDPNDGTMPRTMIDHSEDPLCDRMYQGWKAGEKLKIELLEGDELKNHFQNMGKMIPKQKIFEELVPPDKLYFHLAYFRYGFFVFTTMNPCPENHDIFTRFAKVFEQTYTRFLDLQKAEAQAREAQIEAALERVRSRSMAMQHSSELNEILAKVFEELTNLELQMERAVIWIYYPENRSVRWWAANPEADSGTESFYIANQDDPVYDEYWKAWEERRTKDLYILEGEYKENWTEILFNKTELGRLPQVVKEAMAKPEKLYLYNTFNDFGVLFLGCLEPLSDDKVLILERFGKVFDQSYTRFEDIQKAEAREKEAIRQASLDRVRAEIASMRTTEDLERITPLIWKELTTLNIPFIRCGVFIMDESFQQIHTYLSTPDGNAIAAFHLPYDAPTRTGEILAKWMEKQVYIKHWDETAFSDLGDFLVQQGALPSKDVYLKTIPKGGVHLHCLPFLQGMLYVGNTVELSEDDIELIQVVADAFATAYARYEDFNKLENAKAAVEGAMNELKSTQAQLIQSEKMASLGELTAGVAHEIQNPLNFVNNFSEVSSELVDEMNEELEKGDIEEAKFIAADLKENLSKINHHGKRADAIVKGMLEHSRINKGEKAPTDLNALADEFVRLSYHGLRAKDKSFTADFKLALDPDLPKVNIVAPDIGRVILNLVNNAFYAVDEKAKSANTDSDYKPTVKLSSTYSPLSGGQGGFIQLSVSDNGSGIPDSIKEKIFQPFFTTKPTGSGTGLGLSLSYDIVKAHGGELRVQSDESIGTKFILTLNT